MFIYLVHRGKLTIVKGGEEGNPRFDCDEAVTYRMHKEEAQSVCDTLNEQWYKFTYLRHLACVSNQAVGGGGVELLRCHTASTTAEFDAILEAEGYAGFYRMSEIEVDGELQKSIEAELKEKSKEK
jgi:hypothetical protein